MRLSKVAWSILVGGIFIIAFVGLYLVYLREQRAQEPLNQSLAVAQTILPKLTTEATNLENTLAEMEDRLAQAKSHLQTAKAIFPTRRVESIEVDEVLFGRRQRISRRKISRWKILISPLPLLLYR